MIFLIAIILIAVLSGLHFAVSSAVNNYEGYGVKPRRDVMPGVYKDIHIF